MQPDEAVQLAMQDLRTRAPNTARPRLPEPPHRTLDLLRAWFRPLRRHAEHPRTPVRDGADAGHLPYLHPQPAAAAPGEVLLPVAVEACR